MCVGKLFSFICFLGRNEKGQLGHGDTKRLEAPKLIEGLADHLVVAAACGRNHTLALTGRLSKGVIRCTGGFHHSSNSNYHVLSVHVHTLALFEIITYSKEGTIAKARVK